MTDTKTPTDLRDEARKLEREAFDSFERCDTDGALSQWGLRLSADRLRLQAKIVEEGGTAPFRTLFRLDGTFQPAVEIEGKWGWRWMVLDQDGVRTGQYLPWAPVRRDTLAKHGFVEGIARFPAKAAIRGKDMISCSEVAVKTVLHHEPPVEVITADRWLDPQ
jgi:hypothetical protein